LKKIKSRQLNLLSDGGVVWNRELKGEKMKMILILIITLFAINSYAEENAYSSGVACAIHLEKDYNFKSRLDGLGCKKGDPIMFYNHASKAKWEIILPVRMAALAVCDMSQPISQIGAVGSGSYQSLMCTFSGEYREVKVDGKLKGWNWSDF
tara:strand:- start:202 stop:657 length:456 start_codon:yes stop_codon:yes gene_type:complete